MARYHINPSGSVSNCSAKPGNCPFGGEDLHFTSRNAARDAYEHRMENNLFGKETKMDVRTKGALLDMKIVALKNIADDFLENTEVGGEFEEKYEISEDGETFTLTAKNSFEWGNSLIERGRKMTLDRDLNSLSEAKNLEIFDVTSKMRRAAMSNSFNENTQPWRLASDAIRRELVTKKEAFDIVGFPHERALERFSKEDAEIWNEIDKTFRH